MNTMKFHVCTYQCTTQNRLGKPSPNVKKLLEWPPMKAKQAVQKGHIVVLQSQETIQNWQILSDRNQISGC